MIQSSGVFSLVAFLTVSAPSTTAGFFCRQTALLSVLIRGVALGGFMVATRSGDFQLGLMLAARLRSWCCRRQQMPTRRKGDKRVQATRFACAAPRFRTSTGSEPACTGTRRSLVLAAGGSSAPGHTGRCRTAADSWGNLVLQPQCFPRPLGLIGEA